MFTVYIYKQFNIANSNDSSVIDVKLNAKQIFA
jgi:hypothetical protein